MVLIAALAFILATCAGSAQAQSPLVWGAWFEDSVPWQMAPVQGFEQAVGRPVSVIEFGAPFAHCDPRCAFYGFPSPAMRGIRANGATPMLSWSSQSIPSTTREPDYRLADLIGGRYDGFIRRFALAAKHWGHPFLLRFDWEMNGTWFPWAARANGNRPGQFVAAWRHVHDIFTSVGAMNASWVWCPNIDARHQFTRLGKLYPGNAYVDWTCLDGYNWGNTAHTRWTSFARVFRSTYAEIVHHVAPDKPMIIGEVSSVDGRGGSRAQWIAHMFAALPRLFPQIRGLVWFDRNDGGMGWPLYPGTVALHAFAAGLASAL